jgi:hypothetical protein
MICTMLDLNWPSGSGKEIFVKEKLVNYCNIAMVSLAEEYCRTLNLF